ncbi:hypothetical protein KP509_23G007500 [Ceratopteris richardii]|uniref:Uncharacterized protein n=1 Tax=Ceratopteris richardii TaxID=49495 RepID=A0A8T2RZF4_CERRI|nr:hypothetical protein KP509_23G007500 [Ceratopteris richardii]
MYRCSLIIPSFLKRTLCTKPFTHSVTWTSCGSQLQHICFCGRVQNGMYHIPGYLGHQPLHNPPSATAFNKRTSEKDRMLLYDLDQYSRELWPHYKGHKPQALINVKETPSPTKQTTYGHTNYMMQRQQEWANARRLTKQRIPNQQKKGGIKTFFTQGASGTTSENGVLMAEKYYSFVRPMEGTLISFAADKALASRYFE